MTSRLAAIGIIAGLILSGWYDIHETVRRSRAHGDAQRAFCAALIQRTHDHGLQALHRDEFSTMLQCAHERVREQQEVWR